MNPEPQFRQDWIKQHDQASELLSDKETGLPVAAIYYYPPTKHKVETAQLWEMIAEATLVTNLVEAKS